MDSEGVGNPTCFAWATSADLATLVALPAQKPVTCLRGGIPTEGPTVGSTAEKSSRRARASLHSTPGNAKPRAKPTGCPLMEHGAPLPYCTAGGEPGKGMPLACMRPNSSVSGSPRSQPTAGSSDSNPQACCCSSRSMRVVSDNPGNRGLFGSIYL
ncbi:hypothetical protein AAFF_G00058830 [Aldrovandia affinis]|uniref:Uncharacterized protein n=1 Tax=Aldrovandia affinis TaxID=143900 RepID=A0AAD7S0F8_9TELE|nr:hypothetical protein AAFF_G00058830 [Aldrovandia affinis]